MMGLTSSRPGASAAMPRSSSISTISSARRMASTALSWTGRGSWSSAPSSPAWDATRPKISPLPSRSRPPSATRGARTAAERILNDTLHGSLTPGRGCSWRRSRTTRRRRPRRNRPRKMRWSPLRRPRRASPRRVAGGSTRSTRRDASRKSRWESSRSTPWCSCFLQSGARLRGSTFPSFPLRDSGSPSRSSGTVFPTSGRADRKNRQGKCPYEAETARRQLTES